MFARFPLCWTTTWTVLSEPYMTSTKNHQRKFRRKFPRVPVPCRKTIQNLINKISTVGVLTDWKLRMIEYSKNKN
jgi:hypothetical protein